MVSFRRGIRIFRSQDVEVESRHKKKGKRTLEQIKKHIEFPYQLTFWGPIRGTLRAAGTMAVLTAPGYQVDQVLIGVLQGSQQTYKGNYKVASYTYQVANYLITRY